VQGLEHAGFTMTSSYTDYRGIRGNGVFGHITVLPKTKRVLYNVLASISCTSCNIRLNHASGQLHFHHSLFNRPRRATPRRLALLQPQPRPARNTTRDNIRNKDRHEHPPPSHHNRDLAFNLSPLVFVRERQI
jgi:hypothetical protein